MEYEARAGLMAGRAAAEAVRAGDTSRRALRAYEKAWRLETAVQSRALRWGMEALRRLSDAELNRLFRTLSEVELDEEDLLALLRGNLRSAIQNVGVERSGRVLLGLARGWMRLLVPHQ